LARLLGIFRREGLVLWRQQIIPGLAKPTDKSIAGRIEGKIEGEVAPSAAEVSGVRK